LALRVGRVDFRSLKEEITYEDYRKIFDFTLRELGVEETRQATAEDIVLHATGDPQVFKGRF
jgi:hypothetical protein